MPISRSQFYTALRSGRAWAFKADEEKSGKSEIQKTGADAFKHFRRFDLYFGDRRAFVYGDPAGSHQYF